MPTYGRNIDYFSPLLVEWIILQYGTGNKYTSARELSLAAGLNQNAVNSIILRGRAQPETLMRLADATNTSIRYLFTLARWLPREENRLTPLEEKAISLYRKLPEYKREQFNKLMRALLDFLE